MSSPGAYPAMEYRNSYLLQLFRDCFVDDQKQDSIVFNFDFPILSSTTHNVRPFTFQALLDPDVKVPLSRGVQLIPCIKGKKLVLYYDGRELNVNKPADPIHIQQFISFIGIVDAVLGSDLGSTYKNIESHRMTTRSRTGSKPIPNSPSVTPDLDVDAVLGICKKADDSNKKKKANPLEKGFKDIPWPTRVIPPSLESIFRHNLHPVGEHVPSSIDDWNHLKNFEEDKGWPANFTEFVHPPTQKELKNCLEDESYPIYTINTGKREHCKLMQLKIGDVVCQKQGDGNKLFAQILDFDRGTLCISKFPWRLQDWGPGGAYQPVFRVTKDKDDKQDFRQLPDPRCCIVSRDFFKSRHLIQTFDKLQQERRATIQAAHEQMEDGLEKENLTANYLHTAERRCPFIVEHYPTDHEDPFFRYLDELPPRTVFGHMCSSSLCINRIGPAAGLVTKGKKETLTTCNICGCLFHWNSKGDYLLQDSYGAHHKQFEHENYNKIGMKCCAVDIHKHMKDSPIHGLNNRLVHHYCLTRYPAQTKCWPWEMKVVDLAQEILWVSFVERGGISLAMVKDAIAANDYSVLQLRFLHIISSALTNETDKYKKRLKGCKQMVPHNFSTFPQEFQSYGWVSDSSKKSISDCITKINGVIEEVYTAMTKFSLSVFVQAFPEPMGGNAWNSICLFFAAGLSEHSYFPCLPDINRSESLQSIADEIFIGYVSDAGNGAKDNKRVANKGDGTRGKKKRVVGKPKDETIDDLKIEMEGMLEAATQVQQGELNDLLDTDSIAQL